MIIAFLCPGSLQAITAQDKYYLADACSKDLRRNPDTQKYHHNWVRCIRKFQEVHRHDPSGPWAAAGLFQAAILYQDLYRRSGRKSDELEALEIFKRIVELYPNSRYRQKASDAISTSPEGSRSKEEITAAAPQPAASFEDRKSAAAFTKVTGLRHWSNPNYTRIVIDADQEAAFSHRLLRKDPEINKPQRLYVDLDRCVLGAGAQKIIPINDSYLTDARAGQYTPGTVRVVIDIKSFSTYKIFSLKNPFRIVLDVWGNPKEEGGGEEEKEAPPAAASAGGKASGIPDSALAKQFALGVKKIVIDPGHGGRDFGAPGYIKGVHEKDLALAIARRLSKRIERVLGCQVVMTRNSDRYLTLEERTAIANTENADLFISIHTNATVDRRSFGIETYFLNLATDEESIRVAARENATSTKNISDLQTILNDLMQNAKINESSRLAAYVQTSLYHRMRDRYSQIRNLGVKQAPFYVLLGAQMPSILVETSFISNARECKRLIDAKYQDHLCDGVIEGIRNYIQETNPFVLTGAN